MRVVAAEERSALIDWLDDGLREGRRGRLFAEYPISLRGDEAAGHCAVFEGSRPAAHAMWYLAEACAHGRGVPLGMIGLVYTDPAFRRRGLAGACVDSCVAELRRRGAPLAALWSERRDFYRRLGFHAAGRESLYGIDVGLCRRARADAGPPPELGRAGAGDFAALESLYASKPARARRRPGELAVLAAAPDTQLMVARRHDRPVAYAAMGRGDDFPGVVHEWAGNAEAVLACLEALCGEAGPITWLSGPIDEAPAPALRRAGARGQRGAFALVRLLDAGALWRLLAPELCTRVRLEQCGESVAVTGSKGSAVLTDADALELLLGDGVPPPTLREILTSEERKALADVLPWPLYVWGFDSI